MLFIQTTDNLSGLSIWGNSNSLMQLRELMGKLLEDNQFFKNQKLVDELYSIPYEIRKAYEGHRHHEKHKDFQDNEYSLYGSECILPLFIIQVAMLRQSMSFSENNKKELSLMYSLEYQIEKEIKNFFPKDWEEIIDILPVIAMLNQDIIFEKLPSRCNYFISLKTAKEKEKYLLPILKSFLPYYKNTKLDFSNNEYPNEIIW
ncbi:hypothetical protein NYR77_10755 [Actinobacillus equuli subsp. haemolyticus]|uniref:DUF6904 family protein n=1 Tax=Actinobacillus equuli TaxID=718 RepID=UPI002441B6F0|nr:hypothetical protein [Actinobacillus equuli]WGE67434.1 hypothetical protein NYR77_10755 [Actinobacillus equuli subsp. haemolyticus]